MAKTYKADPPNPYNKECKSARRTTHRKFRHASRLAVRRGLVEPTFKGTEGWLTH